MVSEIENRSVEIIQFGNQKKKRFKANEQSLTPGGK